MKKRLDSLEKISQLQAKLHDLTRWRLAAIGRQRSSLEEAERAMIEALNSDAVGHGAPAAAAARRLRSIGREIAAAKADYDAQSQRVLDQGTRAKLAQRLVENADANYRADKERKDLGDLIERSLGKKTSSA
ncbi:MAG TPA: hypothetical protein VKV96_01245 [Roseiarcus sp.]|nr:hypothetical protein [Roseiarcus sp.]